jgi:hypothetical protein
MIPHTHTHTRVMLGVINFFTKFCLMNDLTSIIEKNLNHVM